MKTRAATSTRADAGRRPRRIVAIALLALGSQAGCGREFYREWANQDVTEAVFEKSRDPRFRIDVFSIDPPALARFANPYDQDRQPAPPDDFVAQSISPVPQWPDHRLMMPLEGTGYLKLLEEGPSYTYPGVKPRTVEAPQPTTTVPPPPPINPGPFKPDSPPTNPDLPAPGSPATPPGPPTPATPGPGASRSNSGTGRAGMSPTSVAARPSPPPRSPRDPAGLRAPSGPRRR